MSVGTNRSAAGDTARSLLGAAEAAPPREAARLLEHALDAAEGSGDLDLEALVNERVAVFYEQTSRPVIAAAHHATAARLRQRLRASEAETLVMARRRLELALRGSSVGAWELDYRDAGEGKAPVFHTINFWEPLGWPPPPEYERDSTATNFRPERFHEGDRQAIYVQLAAHIAGEREELNIPVRMATPDGSWRWCVFRGRAVHDRAGKLVRVLGTTVDITERLALEEETIAATAVAEAANRAKDDFLANVSHEIRTPMNAILGMTELALDASLTSEQRRWLTTVKTAADNLLVIIDELLDLSKATASKLSLSLAEIALREHLRALLGSLFLSAQQKGLLLLLDVAEDVPASVIGDATRLRQILTNLIGNAIKFTSEGRITVVVRVAGQSSGRDLDLSFAIVDTGVGIASDRQAHVFEPFSQADETTSQRFGGTGLGLSIASRLASMMQGRIELVSEPGKGSTFTLVARFGLDVTSPAPDARVPPEPASARERPLRVLVAEDSELNADLVRALLRRRGHEVEVVDNGNDVLRLIEGGSYFDVLLLDLHMPGLDGFQVIARIRAREREIGGRLAVAAVTARSRVEDREQCLAAGMDAFLSKPIRSAALIELIERLAPRRPTAS